ncbi:carboxymethylenebutenolidase, partial [Trifolium medium]|nr:carboxymethylenebutenolidase [Trifolium medium]MCI05486.1 carboxymethylenebutenolidase [Trifolium medium]
CSILVPDLFRGNPWTKDQPNTLFEQWIARHNPERIAKDITAWTEWLADEFMTAGVSKKLGIIGFCFGGGRVLEVLAQDQGDNDPFCTVNEIKNIQMKIDRGSKVVIFPGRGHGFAHRPGSLEEDDDAEQAYVIMRDWIYENLVV